MYWECFGHFQLFSDGSKFKFKLKLSENFNFLIAETLRLVFHLQNQQENIKMHRIVNREITFK